MLQAGVKLKVFSRAIDVFFFCKFVPLLVLINKINVAALKVLIYWRQ